MQTPQVKRLGSYLVDAGLVTAAQVDVALNDQGFNNMRLGDILVTRGWVKQQTLDYLIRKIIEPEQQLARQADFADSMVVQRTPRRTTPPAPQRTTQRAPQRQAPQQSPAQPPQPQQQRRIPHAPTPAPQANVAPQPRPAQPRPQPRPHAPTPQAPAANSEEIFDLEGSTLGDFMEAEPEETIAQARSLDGKRVLDILKPKRQYTLAEEVPTDPGSSNDRKALSSISDDDDMNWVG